MRNIILAWLWNIELSKFLNIISVIFGITGTFYFGKGFYPDKLNLSLKPSEWFFHESSFTVVQEKTTSYDGNNNIIEDHPQSFFEKIDGISDKELPENIRNDNQENRELYKKLLAESKKDLEARRNGFIGTIWLFLGYLLALISNFF